MDHGPVPASPRGDVQPRGPLNPLRDLPGSAGQFHRTSDLGLIRPGQLVNPTGPRTQRESLRRGGRHRKHSHTGLSRPVQLVARAVYRMRVRGLRSDGRPRGPSDSIPITRESCSTCRALGHEHESPRRAGPHRGHYESIESLPGELVDPASPRPEPKTPGRTGRPRESTDPSTSHS